jgi:hypothetical protein
LLREAVEPMALVFGKHSIGCEGSEDCLELCQRLYPVLATQSLRIIIDEGKESSRMTHT